MLFVILALTLCAGPMTAEVDAETEAEQLAKVFSPILILTEETGGKWGDIIVTKPDQAGTCGHHGGSISGESTLYSLFFSYEG